VEQPTFSETALYWKRQQINQSANWRRGLKQSTRWPHLVRLAILVFDQINGLHKRGMWLRSQY